MYCRCTNVLSEAGDVGELGGVVAGAGVDAGAGFGTVDCEAGEEYVARTVVLPGTLLLKFGIVLAESDGLVVRSARFWPQHMIQISLRRLSCGLNNYRLAPQSLEQTGRAGNSQPTHEPFHRLARDKQRKRGRDPQAEAVEAVHQLAGKALAQQLAEAENDVARAVLARQQVSHPPGCENGQDKPQDHITASLPLTLQRWTDESHARRCRRSTDCLRRVGHKGLWSDRVS